MSALDNMKARLQFAGGAPQQSRMISDKLKALKKAMVYSYQAGTLVIDNKSYDPKAVEGIQSLKVLKFRCLMNPDKITFDTDKKMLSIPFKDICLNLEKAGTTSEGVIDIPLACGDTFLWEETNTYWIITLQYIEELAYFRADTRRCFPHPLDINGHSYRFASVGPSQESIEWLRKNLQAYNKLNYTRTLYIKRNQETLDYFTRFKLVKLPDIEGNLKTWEVQTVNTNAVDDILIIHTKEYYENQYEEVSQEEQSIIQEVNELNEYTTVYAYDTFTFATKYIENASWEIKNQSEGLKFSLDAIKKGEDTILQIQLLTGRTGEFDIYYNSQYLKHIIVKSI